MGKTPQNTIGKNIRRLRQKENWTQGQVAKQLKMSIPNFCKIEIGVADITISRLEQIAAVFGVDSTAILKSGDGPVKNEYAVENLRLATLVDEQVEEIKKLQVKLIQLYEEAKNK